MDLEKLLIIVILFAFVVVLIPQIETGIGGVSPSDPMKWLIDWTPLLFLGSVLFTLAMYAVRGRGHN